MKAQTIAVAAALALAGAPAGYAQEHQGGVHDRQPPAATQAQGSAEQFVQKAAVANMFEIEAGKIAVERAQNPRVRAIAQKMIDDHTKAGADLEKALAADGGRITAPKELDAEHQQKLEALRAAPDTSFDDEYVRSQTMAHDQAVELFSRFADSGGDEALRTFAQSTLPTLQAHRKSVHQLSQQLGA